MENNKSRVLIGAVTLVAFIIAYNQHPNELKYANCSVRDVGTFSLFMYLIVVVSILSFTVIHLGTYLVGGYYFVTTHASGYILSPLQPIFSTMPIQARDWLLIGGLSSIPTFLLVGSLLTGKRLRRKSRYI